jgi:hypothetical protein
MLKKLSWIFLAHRLDSEPFNTFSNQTPAIPDNVQAVATAINPANFKNALSLFSSTFPVGNCTDAIPTVNKTSETHFVGVRDRLSITTLNNAVVRIFI